MSLPSPNLDDRRFQDLVDNAKRFIQSRCPEWTDHNVSDPGVALIEAFAHMVDQLSYRLNQIPDKIHLDFLDLLGVTLLPPQAAHTELTFWLSAVLESTVTVPVGVEVATPRAGHGPACIFSVDRALDIVPTEFKHIGMVESGHSAVLVTERFLAGETVTCFSPKPLPGDSLLIGVTHALPRCALALRIDCSLEGIGVDPRRPPLVWEAWCAEGWSPCEVHRDSTGGLNRPGEVVLFVPDGHTPSLIGRRRAAWLRCRVEDPAPGQPAYAASPQIKSVEAFTVGGTTTAVHGEVISNEDLGTSDGTPGQRFPLEHTPIAGGSLCTLTTDDSGGRQQWTRVATFADSGPQDRHVTVDEVAGEVQFGPAVREPDGLVRQYGAVPVIGARVSAGGYRRGGGRVGNVAAHTLTVLRTPIALVGRVENRTGAVGGVDAESLEGVRRRAAQWLRTQERAVTARDYEAIAQAACRQLGRVECVAETEEGSAPLVRVLVVPQITDKQAVDTWRELVPSQATIDTVAEAIEAARPLGTRVAVSGPAYQGVTVVAEVESVRGAEPAAVREEVLRTLRMFLSPLPSEHGESQGWPMGRALRMSDVYAVVAGCAGVEAVTKAELYAADLATGERRQVEQRMSIGPTTLFLSYRHQVAVTKPQ
ncbi:putative baseplate assembly protein [Streptomyces kronopolitis]|uniref:putative baseplate assembly protein n=1 Tax=Streptomyces kronopolitis TaxID=1612435 RepID=UPI0020BFEC78|nr:putative baseplate assembly protein [Streptomyces kronopolitis]MCL6302590.1 putative baseplate assembly protein [Streptomyces kronopolitis]